MPTYVKPQSQAFNDFNRSPLAQRFIRGPHIAGGHAALVRYAQPTERPNGALGIYNNAVATTYSWPNQPAGSIIDLSYVKLWAQNVLLQYWEGSQAVGDLITKTAGFNNRIRNASQAFAANPLNPVTYPRDVDFLDRDVTVGDVVKVRGLDSNNVMQTLWSTVQALIGDPIPAVVNAATADSGDAVTQLLSVAVTKIAGLTNCLDPSADATLYNGLPTGDIIETYDIIVTAPSTGANLPTATLRVISGSGRDNQAAVTPAPRGQPTAIGTRGLKVTFNFDHTFACSHSAQIEGVSPEDLLVGQHWQVVVHQAFTAPVATSGGSYAGGGGPTYIIKVTRGGRYTDTLKPQITVSTSDGSDVSGPTTVPAAGTAVAVGTQGVTVSFSGTALCGNDRYYIVITAATTGAMKTMVLNNNLASTLASSTNLDVTLFIKHALQQIPANQMTPVPELNWIASAASFIVEAGIQAYDPTWTSAGVPQPLSLVSEISQSYGLLFVEYRAWLSTLCTGVFSITSATVLDAAISGALDPDNPLKEGVSKALANSNGAPVLYSSVCNPSDPNSWASMLTLLVARDDIYGMVPLSTSPTIQALYQAQIDSLSSPTQKLWREGWLNLPGIPTAPIVSNGSTVPGYTKATTLDGNLALCTIEQDPSVGSPSYTIIRCPAANAGFQANGVLPGDIVRTLFTSDPFGNVTHSEFVVASVVSDSQLKLVAGPTAASLVPAKTEVWRVFTPDQEAAALGNIALSFNDQNINLVWPDFVSNLGVVMPGYFMCCALAGLTAGILPHQGIKHLQIIGFDGRAPSVKFNGTEKDTMAAAGIFIVDQDPVTNQMYTRNAVTTGLTTNINAREEVLNRNLDNIQYRFKDALAPFFGVTNITPGTAKRIELTVNGVVSALKTEAQTNDLGGQILSGTVVSIAQSLAAIDQYVVVIDASLPPPFNDASIQILLV
jgi:hypothetical protein